MTFRGVRSLAFNLSGFVDMKANIEYFFSDLDAGVFAVVEGGVRVVWDSTRTHETGEFIAAEDFVDDAFVAVHYPMAVDFSDAWSLRQATEEVSLEAETVAPSWAAHHAAVVAMAGE